MFIYERMGVVIIIPVRIFVLGFGFSGAKNASVTFPIKESYYGGLVLPKMSNIELNKLFYMVMCQIFDPKRKLLT